MAAAETHSTSDVLKVEDVPPELVDVTPEQSVDDAYFDSYEDATVHELMLKDRPRTLAYKTFIEKNDYLFENKIVIDVGAGTGILSMIAAKAGAGRVYAIEASKLSHACEAIVAKNKLSHVITVLHGRAEDVCLPPGVKADIIISEWMGFYLFHESMLNSVIKAREKWLAPDGIMLPSSASLYLCPVTMKDYVQDHFNFWRNVYGFDMSPLLPSIHRTSLTRPTITAVEARQCLARAELVTHLDMLYVLPDDLKTIKGTFNFEYTKNDILHGFVCWFDVEFAGEPDITLSTSPLSPKTHWEQTVIMLPDALMANRTETIGCKFEMQQDPSNMRRYNIALELVEDEDEEEEEEALENGETGQDVSMEDEQYQVFSQSAMGNYAAGDTNEDMKDILIQAMAEKYGGSAGGS